MIPAARAEAETMNAETLALLNDVTGRVQRNILAMECPAIVLLSGEKDLALSDYDYLRDNDTAAAFERRAADLFHQIHGVRWVIAVPLVLIESDGGTSARAVSNDPLRPGEQEAISWMSFDRADGMDVGRLSYTRRPGGQPVWGDLETRVAPARVLPANPGYLLLTLTAEQ
jgi:hypothetical protein